MLLVKQSTAITVSIGPCLDSTGAEYTGLVISDLTINKAGTDSAMAAAATLTHVSNGHYTLLFLTTNLGTLGTCQVRCNKATYQIPTLEMMVLPATVYDALVTNATTAAGGLGDIQRMAGTALTARDIGASVLLSSGTGTGQVKLSSGYVAPNWGDVGNPTTTVGLSGTTVKTATDVETDTQDIQSKLGTPAVSVAADIADLPTNAELATALGTADDAVLTAIATAQSDLDILTGSDGVTLATAQGNYAPAKASDVNAQVLDVLNVDTLVAGKTIADALAIIGASAGGVISGAGSGTEVFKDFAGNTKLTVTVDSSGNRTVTVYA